MSDYIQIMIDNESRSTSYLQNKLRISYEQAKKICYDIEPYKLKILEKKKMDRFAPEICMVKKIKQRTTK